MKTFLQPIHSLYQVFSDSLGGMSKQIFSKLHALFNPQLRYEGNGLVISAPVPGKRKEDLTMYVAGRVLVIDTKRMGEPIGNSTGSHRDVKYTFLLPEGIDLNNIHAKCRNGVLTVKIERIKTKKDPIVINVFGGEENARITQHKSKLWNKIKEKIAVRKLNKNASRVNSSS